MKPTVTTAYNEYKKSADKLLAAAQALAQTRERPDGPGVLELPGLLAKLRAAAEDLAAVKVIHEAENSAGHERAAQPAASPVNAGGHPWIRVQGDSLYISRCDWIYPNATGEESGVRDEARYQAIGKRDGDMVLHFNGAWADAQDLATMLTYEPRHG